MTIFVPMWLFVWLSSAVVAVVLFVFGMGLYVCYGIVRK